MPLTSSTVTEADGSVWVEIRDDGGNLRERYPERDQPQNVRWRDAARGAIEDWRLLRDLRAELVTGGQAYWDTIAPDAGLPTGSAAYNTALSFLATRRDKAMSRAAAAVNRWRLA